MKQTKLMNLLLAAVFFSATLVYAQPGLQPADLNASFGPFGTGITETRPGSATDLVVQSNNELIVNRGTTINRHQPNGALISTAPCPFPGCFALQRQSDDFIIWAGTTAAGELGITRLRPDLSLDTSFGVGGIILTRIAGQSSNRVEAIVMDKKDILIAGNAGPDVGNYRLSRQFVARFDKNGFPDSSFGRKLGGVGGFVFESGSDLFGTSIDLQGSNIVVGGVNIVNNNAYAITVYNSKGERSANFNNGNPVYVIALGAGGPGATSVAVQSDMKIVFIMYDPSYVAPSKILTRLNPDGTLDGSFGTGGFALAPAVTDYGINFETLKIDQFGRIVVAGNWYEVQPDHISLRVGFTIARFTLTGQLDTTFTNSVEMRYGAGIRIFDLGPLVSRRVGFWGLGFQSNGNIVVTATNTSNPASGELYRFNGN